MSDKRQTYLVQKDGSEILLEGLHQLGDGDAFRMEGDDLCDEGIWIAKGRPFLENGAWTIQAYPQGAPH